MKIKAEAAVVMLDERPVTLQRSVFAGGYRRGLGYEDDYALGGAGFFAASRSSCMRAASRLA